MEFKRRDQSFAHNMTNCVGCFLPLSPHQAAATRSLPTLQNIQIMTPPSPVQILTFLDNCIGINVLICAWEYEAIAYHPGQADLLSVSVSECFH